MTEDPAHAAAADATGRPDAVADATPSPPAGASAAHPLAVDPVTQVQDAIDGLSLSIFEALRGLRDAVAPDNAQDGEDGGAIGAILPSLLLEHGQYEGRGGERGGGGDAEGLDGRGEDRADESVVQR